MSQVAGRNTLVNGPVIRLPWQHGKVRREVVGVRACREAENGHASDTEGMDRRVPFAYQVPFPPTRFLSDSYGAIGGSGKDAGSSVWSGPVVERFVGGADGDQGMGDCHWGSVP